MRKASLAILLLAGFICLTISGCDTPEPVLEPSEAEVSEQSVEESVEEPKLFANLPDRYYDGKTVTFLVEGDYMTSYKSVEVVPHEDSYETLNNAITARNDLVTEKFGIEINTVRTEGYGDMLARMRTSSMSGVNEYDVVMPYFGDAALFAQEGGLYDLRTLENIHYNEPYYDQGSVRDLSILGKNYFITGDLSLLSYDVTHILTFDKEMIESYHLESPYDLVENHEWTIDKLWEMAKKVTADIDGEPGMGYLDRFGYLVNNNFTSTMFIGAGQRFSRKDGEDKPIITVYSEESVAVFNKIFDLINDPTASGKLDDASGGFWTSAQRAGKNLWEAANDASADGRALFHAITVGTILDLGEYECSFGVLPAPMYDKNQGQYYSRVSTIYGTCVAVPLNVQDAEMSSIIIDAMMQASTSTVKVAYFDVIMKERKIQDYESEHMLDIILDSRVYDFGSIYNWGQSAHGSGSFTGFMDTIAFSGENTFVSTWESIKNAVQADLNATVAVYEAVAK